MCVYLSECRRGEREGIIGLCGLDLTLSTTRGFHIEFSSIAKLFSSTTSEQTGRVTDDEKGTQIQYHLYSLTTLS